jgi:hypothetical protein
MFLCIVLIGHTVKLPPGKYSIPPTKDGKNGSERYDSIHNANADHYIVYDNAKAYPGFLITY